MPIPVSGLSNSFTLTGIEPVLRLMAKLPRDLEKRGFKIATRAGATVLKKAAAENFKTHDREASKDQKIFKNVIVQFAPKSSKAKRSIVMRTGVLGGAAQYGNTKENVRKGRVGKTYATGGDSGNPGGDTWYWRFVEFGVPAHKIRAKRPMQKALETKASDVAAVFVRTAEREVFSTVDRLKRGG